MGRIKVVQLSFQDNYEVGCRCLDCTSFMDSEDVTHCDTCNSENLAIELVAEDTRCYVCHELEMQDTRYYGALTIKGTPNHDEKCCESCTEHLLDAINEFGNEIPKDIFFKEKEY